VFCQFISYEYSFHGSGTKQTWQFENGFMIYFQVEPAIGAALLAWSHLRKESTLENGS
jgi:hypothetical protein